MKLNAAERELLEEIRSQARRGYEAEPRAAIVQDLRWLLRVVDGCLGGNDEVPHPG